MSPASGNPAGNTPDTNAKRVVVPAPAAGAGVAVTSVPGGELELGFDPGQATATRSGNNLVFDVDGGGVVTITDFFVVGEETLPALRLPDGEVVATADFFAGSDLDLSTAAGPAAGAPGSGGTNYTDDAGNLLGGVDKFGMLGTDYWARSTETSDLTRGIIFPSLTFGLGAEEGMTLAVDSLNESDGGTFFNLSFTDPLITTATLTFTLGGDARALGGLDGKGNTVEEFNHDFDVDVTGGPGYTVTFDPVAGVMVVTLEAGVQNVSIPILVGDDHLNESNETVTFTLTESTGNIIAPTGLTVTLNLLEDTLTHTDANPHGGSESGILDGPIVNIAPPAPASADEGAAVPGTKSMSFKVEFEDPHTGGDYKGFGPEQFLSQDMTIKFTVSPITNTDAPDSSAAGAVYGEDYKFDLVSIGNIPGVRSAEYEDGVLTVNLIGRADENGDLNADEAGAFRFDGDGLELKVNIINDAVTERTATAFEIKVGDTTGNESLPGTGVVGTINPDAKGNFNGPTLNLTGDERIAESGADDGPYVATNNTAKYKITLQDDFGAPQAADEPIRIEVTVKAGTADKGGHKSDFTFDGKFQAVFESEADAIAAGGTITQIDGGKWTVTITDVEPVGGDTYALAIPKGATEVRFETDIVDDLRETNESEENYTVSFELVKTDADGNIDPNGLPDGEARTGTKTVTTIIADDVRGDSGSERLNPEDFDGPFVSIGVGSVVDGVFKPDDNAADYRVEESSDTVDADGKTVPNTVPFVISLLSPDGAGTPFTAMEGITVTLDIKAGELDANGKATNGFSLSDLFEPESNGAINGKITVYFFKEDGTPINADGTDVTAGTTQTGQERTITGDAWDPASTLTLTLPKGAAYAKFDVPVHDDPLGGIESSAKDQQLGESFTVTIADLSGNEARAFDSTESGKTTGSISAGATIIDDDSKDTILDEGVQFGLSWNATPVTKGNNSYDQVEEGLSYKVDINVYDKNGAALTTNNNPYKGYVENGGDTLPENLTLRLNLNPTKDATSGVGATSDADDLDFTFGGLETLLADGKIKLTVGGTEYTTGDDLPPTVESGTVVEVTLLNGKFDLATDTGKLNFGINVTGDNINEWDAVKKYADGQTQDSESIYISLEVDGANESSVKSGGGSLTSVITDVADGVLSWHEEWTTKIDDNGKPVIEDGKEVLERTDYPGKLKDGEWQFTIDVAYTDEKGNLLNEGNQPAGSSPQTPDEPVHFRLKFSDTEYMQQGEDQEYVVTAYTLFLSANKGNPNLANFQASTEPKITDAASYNQWLDSLDTEDYAAMRTLAENGDKGVVLVSGSRDWGIVSGDTHQSAEFDFYVPTTDAGFGDGSVSFGIAPGQNYGSSGGGFKVEMVDPYKDAENKLFDIKGEIVEVDDNNTTSAEVAGKILLGLKGGKSIHEEPGMDNTVDSYTVTFTPDGGAEPTGTWSAAGDITVDMVLTGMTLDTNTTDNYLKNSIDDLSLCDEDGNTFVYTSLKSSDPMDGDTLLGQLNIWLAGQTGGQVSVTDIEVADIEGTAPQYTFKLEIEEGYDLSQGVPFNFKALDDGESDSESFSLTIVDVGSHLNINDSTTVENPLSVAIDAANAPRTGTTNVGDETTTGPKEDLNGFEIELALSAKGKEAYTDGDGNGYNQVSVPVYAYILDDGYHLDAQGNVVYNADAANERITTQELVNRFNALNDSSYETFDDLDPADQPAFVQFVYEKFGPTQDITVGYGLKGGTSAGGEDGTPDTPANAKDDYISNSSSTIAPGDWTLVITPDGEIYFTVLDSQTAPAEGSTLYRQDGNGKAVADAVFAKEAETDSQSKGVLIETVRDYLSEGDETFTLTVTGVSGNESRLVVENQKIPVTILDVIDGPHIVDFFVDRVSEPVPGYMFGDPAPAAGKLATLTNISTYSIVLDGEVSEPVIVWLNMADTTATLDVGNGGDFVLGKGIYQYEDGKVWRFDPELPGGKVALTITDGAGTRDMTFDEFKTANGMGDYAKVPENGGYFTCIGIKDPTDSSAPINKSGTSFEVHIKHDNDTVNDRDSGPMEEGDIDRTGQETIKFTITDVQGSEVTDKDGKTVDSKHDGITTTDAIADDMAGPFASVTTTGQSKDNVVFTVTLQDKATEDVVLEVKIVDTNGNPVLDKNGDPYTVTVKAGDTTAELTVPRDLTGWVYSESAGKYVGRIPGMYASFAEVDGGEARDDGQMAQARDIIGGDIPPIRVTHIESVDDISEGALGKPDDAVEYKITLAIPADGDRGFTLPDSASFTLRVTHGTTDNPDLDGFTDEDEFIDITVTLDQAALEAIRTAGGNVIVENKDGKPVLYLVDSQGVKGEEPLGGATLTGTLPAALGDDVLEGDEYFNTMVLGNGNVIIQLDDDSNLSTAVKDSPAGIVLLDKAGNLLSTPEFSEGSNEQVITAQLVLMTEDGKYVGANGTAYATPEDAADPEKGGGLVRVTPKYPVELEISHNTTGIAGDTATEGADYHYQKVVVIDPATGTGTIKVFFPDDAINENDEQFNLSVTVSDGSKTLYPGVEITAPAETLVTITENREPPMRIDWEISSHADEGGAITLDVETFKQGVRQVTEEDVEMIFVITPKPVDPVTGKGFDVETELGTSITVGGTTLMITEGDADPRPITFEDLLLDKKPDAPMEDAVKLEKVGDNYELTLTMPEHTAMYNVTLGVGNDRLDEKNEGFTIALKEVDGSEITEWNNKDTALDVSITDDNNGYTMKVSADKDTTNETNGVDVVLAFEGKKETNSPEEPVEVTMELAKSAAEMLSGMPTVDLPGATLAYTYREDDPSLIHTVTLTLPADMDPGDVRVNFPVKDDSVAAERYFDVKEITVTGGEVTRPEGSPLVYTSEFVYEQGPLSGNGGYTELKLNTSDPRALEARGNMEITLNDVNPDVIQTLSIGSGTALKEFDSKEEAKEALKEGTSGWYIDADSGKPVMLLAGVQKDCTIRVTYDEIKDTNKADITNAKVNGALSVKAQLDSTGVGITVKNDEDKLSGPEVKLDFDTVTATEGVETMLGTLVITLPNLAGDKPNVLLEDMEVVIKVPDGFKTVSIGGETLTPENGTVTVIIPKDSEVTDGKLVLPFGGTPKDNAISGTSEEQQFSIESVGSAEEGKSKWETYKPDTDPVTVTVVDDPQADWDGPVFTVAAADGGTAGEGGTAFIIKGAPQTGFTTTEQEITLTFTITGNPGTVLLNGITPIPANGSGEYAVTVPAGTNMNTWAANISIAGDDVIGTAAGELTLTLTEVSNGEATLGTDTAAIVTILDADSTTAANALSTSGVDGIEINDLKDMVLVQPEGNHTADPASDNGEFIIGGAGGQELVGGDMGDIILGVAGDNTIRGGGGNDTIIGGIGTNLLNGGEGDDIFVWTAKTFGGGKDTVEDFDFANGGTTGDSLRFDSIFADTGEGSLDNLLDGLTAEGGGTPPYTFSATDSEGRSIKATFDSDAKLLLTISNDGDEQVVEINAAADTPFAADVSQLGAEEAADILRQIIITNS